jgi:hypothetical protein
MRGPIPPLPQYAFMAGCSVTKKQQRDNFTFTYSADPPPPIHTTTRQKTCQVTLEIKHVGRRRETSSIFSSISCILDKEHMKITI